MQVLHRVVSAAYNLLTGVFRQGYVLIGSLATIGEHSGECDPRHGCPP